MRNIIMAALILGGAAFAHASQWDTTGFFLTDRPNLDFNQNRWTFANEAITVTFRYESQSGGLVLEQVFDKQRKRALLKEPAALLALTNPTGNTVLDLSRGWDLVAAPRTLTARLNAKQPGTLGADIELCGREPSALADGLITAILKITIFPGNEPYLTLEPILQARWKAKTHIDTVRYVRLTPANGGRVLPFADKTPPPAGIDEKNLQTWSPQTCTNQHTIPCSDGTGGMWISLSQYNPRIQQVDSNVEAAALANVYLDRYWPLTNGSLGTMMLGVFQGPREAALFDYQLFLIKHWIAGDHRIIPPHVHDYWYATQKGVTESQPARLEKLAPLIQESGFHFFWFIYEFHGDWPDWRLEPPEYFPGGVNADDPASIAAVLARHNIGLGLYTAPCTVGKKLQYELRHEDCRLYGDLLGRRARQAESKLWWYEDHPGEDYQVETDGPNQPAGNCSWMWLQGYLIARQAARRHVPDLAFSRTWVDSVEQLGWSEATACLDVFGMEGGNQSGGPTRRHDLFLADAWRNTVWRMVPVWPLMNHLGHHPVHIRDANRRTEDTEYIDCSAAMYGPFNLNGPLIDTTPDERRIHQKWADFNWKYREFLRFSVLPEYQGDPGKLDGIYHLANPDTDGLCGFIGLWNKDDDKSAETTLIIRPANSRLRWPAEMTARLWDRSETAPIRRKNDHYVLGPIKLPPRSAAVLEIRRK